MLTVGLGYTNEKGYNMKKMLLLGCFPLLLAASANNNIDPNDILLAIGNQKAGILKASHKEPLTKKTFGTLLSDHFQSGGGFRSPGAYNFFRVFAPNGSQHFFDKNAYIRKVNPSRNFDFSKQKIPGTSHTPTTIETFIVQPKVPIIYDKDDPYLARRGQVFGQQQQSMACPRTAQQIQGSRGGYQM